MDADQNPTRYEVELKFALPGPEAERIRQALAARGLTWGPAQRQEDRYLAHPDRDFAETDEALRIRREDDRTYLTYKGPKIDPASKTRREIELRMPDAAAGEQLAALFDALGFVAFATVRKSRTPGSLAYRDRSVGVSLDEVEGLGPFIEFETLAPPTEIQPAREAITALAAELGLSHGIRRSYLEMLLDRAA